MIVPYTNLYDEVLADVPGVPQGVARNAIRNAVIEFCARTNIWVVDHDPISTVTNTSTYQFEPPNGAVVVAVKVARYNGLRIYPATREQLDNEYINWPSLTGQPKWYLQENTEELILVPMPGSDLTDGLAMKVALKPSRASSGVEGWIIEMYQEELAHGAKGKLMTMKKKPWSDPALAAYHIGKFDSAINKASIYASKSLGKGKMRTVARFF